MRQDIAPVRLVVDHHTWDLPCAQLTDDLLDRCCLRLPEGVGNIHHVQQKVGVLELLKRCLERRHQMVRQLADKTDRVRQKDFLRV